MTSDSAGPIPSARAGNVSVPKSIANICITVMGNGILNITIRMNGMISAGAVFLFSFFTFFTLEMHVSL